jgi:hypothetical protein
MPGAHIPSFWHNSLDDVTSLESQKLPASTFFRLHFA